jgi:hypothetical protein
MTKDQKTIKLLKQVTREISDLRVSFNELQKVAPWLFHMNNPSQIEHIKDDWDVWTTDGILERLNDDISEMLEQIFIEKEEKNE